MGCLNCNDTRGGGGGVVVSFLPIIVPTKIDINYAFRSNIGYKSWAFFDSMFKCILLIFFILQQFQWQTSTIVTSINE